MNVSPTTHPNAYASVSSGSLAVFLVHEAKTRLGINLTLEEAGYIVVAVSGAMLFLGRFLSQPNSR